VARHLELSVSLAEAIAVPPRRFLDLGSGGGVPGLVLAQCWPRADAVLLDAKQRRCGFLADAVRGLGWADRVTVRCGRAEVLARDPDLRASVDLVVARGFGRPAVTAECAVGFLPPGGRLVVTEPPGSAVPDPGRWPAERLHELGLSPASAIRSGAAGAVVMTSMSPPDPRWPRATGRPAKSPLW
jgi:16S rRNA (guanine527-N7)-methyltransferase